MFVIDPYRFGGGGGGGTDPQIAFVSGLYHLDTDGTNTVTGIPNLTIAPATISATAKWGAGSVATTSASGGSTHAGGTDSLNFGTGDYVIECWFNSSVANQGSNIIETRSNATSSPDRDWPVIFINTDNSVNAFIGNATRISSAASVISTSTWYYTALARASGTSRLYLGTSGTASQVGSDYADTWNLTGVAVAALALGQAFNGGGRFDGFIDDVRITVGHARGYTGASISVPTAAFPDS